MNKEEFWVHLLNLNKLYKVLLKKETVNEWQAHGLSLASV